MPSFDDKVGSSGQPPPPPADGLESQPKGKRAGGPTDEVLQKVQPLPGAAVDPMASRGPSLASGQNNRTFAEIQSLLTQIQDIVADASRGSLPAEAAKPGPRPRAGSAAKPNQMPRQENQPEEEEDYLDPSARPDAYRAQRNRSASVDRGAHKLSIASDGSGRSERSLRSTHGSQPPPRPSVDEEPHPPGNRPPAADALSRRAHREQESESQARVSLGRNVKALFAPFVVGGRSLYRSLRGHEQAGTATVGDMRRGSKLQRLMDARTAMSDVKRYMTRPRPSPSNPRSQSVDWELWEDEAQEWRDDLEESTVITARMQRKSTAAERIVEARATLEEHGIDPDSPIDSIRTALDGKVREAAADAKAGATGSPSRALRMAVRDELPRLGRRLDLGDNPLAHVDTLNHIVEHSDNQDLVEHARRALGIGRELIEHGVDPTLPRAEIEQALEKRLTDGDRLKDLSRAADRLKMLQTAQAAVRELRPRVPAVARPDDSEQVKKDRLELERNARIVARLGPHQYSLINEAVQRHAQLAARTGITYGDAAEAFKHSQYDSPIRRSSPLFRGSPADREAAIDIAAQRLDADKARPNADPHGFYRRDEELLMAKESLVRDKIKDLDQRWKTGLYTSGKRLEWISRSMADQKARLHEILAAKQNLGERRDARLAHLNKAQLLKYENAFERIGNDFDEVRQSLGVARELSETRSGWFAAAAKAMWRGVKALLSHPNEVKEIAKMSARGLEAGGGVHEVAEGANAGLDGAATDLMVVEKFFGVYKSAVAFGKNIREALKTQDFPELPGGAERGTAAWYREAPYRMLSSNREAVKGHLPGWALYDMTADGIATVRYGGEMFADSTRIAGEHSRKAADLAASAGMHGAMKAMPVAGGALAAAKAVKKTAQAGVAASENSKRGNALKKTRTELADHHDPEIADSLRDLENLHALAKERSDVKTKLVGAGKDLVHAGGYAVAAAAAFGAGGTALATIGAPVAGGVAAGAALAYVVGKQVKAYNRKELLKLHQDALIGRVGDKTANKLLKEARDAGFEDPRDYLDQQLMRQDVRYATQRLVMNLKREIRANTDLGDGSIDDYIEQRVGSATVGARSAAVTRDAQGAVDIYSDPVYRDEDARRLDASPTARFLRNMGMTDAQVLALADSGDDAESLEATRMLIQTHLKIKG